MLKIQDTLTGKLEKFTPQEPGKVKFYHCGPTVYWTQHIGNMRGMTMADLIRRSLIYLGYDVSFVRNYTDVGHLTSDEDEGEDKMEKGAKREGLSPQKIADKYIKIFEDDVSALNMLPSDFTPRATDFVEQMIEMDQMLLDKGYAYLTPNALYFDVSKFPDYNKLNKQNLEMNRSGAGTGDISDSEKRHPADFALWFFKTGKHKNALQVWESPFESPEVENGLGFPGWHIECSAMARALLGNTLDIHMGGIEHIPVHHTNEIAQSEAATGEHFVRYWIHNEHLTVDGEKMAKSVGNVHSVSELREKGYDPIALRYFFLQSHYRSKQNFTLEALDAAQIALSKLSDFAAQQKESKTSLGNISELHKKSFVEALENDFNIPQALAVAWDVLKSDNAKEDIYATLLDFDTVFGLRLSEQEKTKVEITPEVASLLEDREKARENKDWATSDRVRDLLLNEHGIVVKDTVDGQSIFRL
jgi:cysteinyl-tRNA synthetase